MTDSQLKAAFKADLNHHQWTYRFGKRIARRLGVSVDRLDAVYKDIGAVKVNGSYALVSRVAGKLAGRAFKTA